MSKRNKKTSAFVHPDQVVHKNNEERLRIVQDMKKNPKTHKPGAHAPVVSKNMAGNNMRNMTLKQKAATHTLKAANAVGRWFGVAGDEKEMADMQALHNRRRSKGVQAIGFDDDEGKKPPVAPRNNRGVPVSQKAAQQAQNAMRQSSSESEAEDEKIDDIPTTRDFQKGLEHYRTLRYKERQAIAHPLWFANEKAEEEKKKRDPSKPKEKRLRRNDTLVAMQLQALPTFTPWFIYLTSAIQVIIFLLVAAHAYTTGTWATFGLTDKEYTCSVSPVSDPPCPELFNGTFLDGSVYKKKVNFLWGPTTKYLLSLGAKFSLCMRDDTDVKIYAAKERETQCGTTYTCESGSGYSCCHLPSSNRRGMTSQADCLAAEAGATWTANQKCNIITDFVYIKPCCGIGFNAECQILTETACSFYGGTWMTDEVLCADITCLTPLCELLRGGYAVNSDSSLLNQPANPNQWFRLIVPLYIHAGVIQLAIVMFIQLYAGTKIETQAGFLRTLLIYFISGIGGYVISGIFSPKTVNLGADPAVYGLLAVMVVELFQFWQIVPSPFWELFRLGFLVLVLLMIGTLPYVDNWSHIGGFTFGILAGIIFLPYLTFGKWDLRRKRLILFIAFPLLLACFIMAFIGFYQIQNTNFCTWCKYVNCIPYTSAINCDESS